LADDIALSVVMVTRNERGSVESVVKSIREVAPEAEILIVDSSDDDTAGVATDAGCKVIRQYPPQGYGPALGMALRSACGNVIITMDCDGTYPAEAILRLRKCIDDGAELASANRLHGKPKHMPLANYAANKLFAALALIICGLEVSDLHTGMRAYRRKLIHSFEFDANGMALPVELLLGPMKMGHRHAQIDIEYCERIGQSKLDPIKGTYWTLKRLWKFRR
jgi:glycosyltransferase involved in cell wall biosynthesis